MFNYIVISIDLNKQYSVNVLEYLTKKINDTNNQDNAYTVSTILPEESIIYIILYNQDEESILE